MGKNSFKSESGRTYTTEGDHRYGYSVKDDNDNKSVFGFDDYSNLQRHVENVEKGTQADAGNFGK